MWLGILIIFAEPIINFPAGINKNLIPTEFTKIFSGCLANIGKQFSEINNSVMKETIRVDFTCIPFDSLVGPVYISSIPNSPVPQELRLSNSTQVYCLQLTASRTRWRHFSFDFSPEILIFRTIPDFLILCSLILPNGSCKK